jgi:hypothetical protein
MNSKKISTIIRMKPRKLYKRKAIINVKEELNKDMGNIKKKKKNQIETLQTGAIQDGR